MNVLELLLLNLHLANIGVVVKLHRHNNMLDTNRMMIIVMQDPKTERTSRLANQRMIMVEAGYAESKAHHDSMSVERNTRDVYES
jgi:hypothetical protein